MITKTLTLNESEIGRAVLHWLRCTGQIDAVDDVSQVEFAALHVGTGDEHDTVIEAEVAIAVEVEDPAGGGI